MNTYEEFARATEFFDAEFPSPGPRPSPGGSGLTGPWRARHRSAIWPAKLASGIASPAS